MRTRDALQIGHQKEGNENLSWLLDKNSQAWKTKLNSQSILELPWLLDVDKLRTNPTDYWERREGRVNLHL